jgi:hypothetical protein
MQLIQAQLAHVTALRTRATAWLAAITAVVGLAASSRPDPLARYGMWTLVLYVIVLAVCLWILALANWAFGLRPRGLMQGRPIADVLTDLVTFWNHNARMIERRNLAFTGALIVGAGAVQLLPLDLARYATHSGFCGAVHKRPPAARQGAVDYPEGQRSPPRAPQSKARGGDPVGRASGIQTIPASEHARASLTSPGPERGS